MGTIAKGCEFIWIREKSRWASSESDSNFRKGGSLLEIDRRHAGAMHVKVGAEKIQQNIEGEIVFVA